MTDHERRVAEELRAQLTALLVEIVAGRVEASPTYRARIEGAVVALGVVLDGRADDVLERFAADIP